MSTRNKYDAKRGVARIRWKEGAPPSSGYGPYLVETWQADMSAPPWKNVPQVVIRARVEIRVRTDAGWHEVRPGGSLKPVDNTAKEFRRYAELPVRNWWGNITIDGWTEEPKE
jgi:hypothetical protein